MRFVPPRRDSSACPILFLLFQRALPSSSLSCNERGMGRTTKRGRRFCAVRQSGGGGDGGRAARALPSAGGMVAEQLCTLHGVLVLVHRCVTEVERRIALSARDGEPHRAGTVAHRRPPLRLAATVLCASLAQWRRMAATNGSTSTSARACFAVGAPTNSSGRALCSEGSAGPPPRPLCSTAIHATTRRFTQKTRSAPANNTAHSTCHLPSTAVCSDGCEQVDDKNKITLVASVVLRSSFLSRSAATTRMRTSAFDGALAAHASP